MTADTIEYTIFPLSQIPSYTFGGNIANVGATAATNAVMSVTVNDGISNIWTGSSTPIPTLAVGADQDVTTTTGWPGVTGSFTITYQASITETDIDPANNVDTKSLLVSDSVYARDDGTVTGALGIGAGNGGWLGNEYTLVAGAEITSISYYVTRGYTGRPMACVVWNMVAGLPSAVVASTDTLLYPNDSAAFYTLNIAGGPVPLVPGDYVVTICEFDSTVQLGLTNTIFTPGKTWVNWPTSPAGGWANNEYFGVPSFNKAYVIRPNFNPTLVSINDHSNISNVVVYPNPSDGLVYIKNAANERLIVNDLTGRQIYNGLIDSDHFELDLSRYEIGMYFLNINNNVYKVVVN
jgi:hypothetical protein